MSQSHDRRVLSRLESLPTELIENIAKYLDTTSHKQLRLSSRYLDAMSTHTFGARIKSAAFFFTRTSMERLALLSKSTGWTKYVNSLEINKSCLRPSEWPRWSNHWGLHQEETYRDPLRRVPGWKLHFEPMTAVQTLVVDLHTFVSNERINLHCLIPRLYAALPNLATLELKNGGMLKSAHAAYDDSKRLADFPWAPLSPMPNLRHLSITNCYFPSTRALADTIRAQKDVLRTVSISDTRCDGSWLQIFQVMRHELPLLDNIVFVRNQQHYVTLQGWWSDGTVDFGENAQRLISEKGIRRALDEMISMFRGTIQ